jgi:hypothetical protein
VMSEGVVGWLPLTGVELYALLLAWLHIWMWNSDKQASMSRCLCCPKTKGGGGAVAGAGGQW